MIRDISLPSMATVTSWTAFIGLYLAATELYWPDFGNVLIGSMLIIIVIIVYVKVWMDWFDPLFYEVFDNTD